MTAKLMRLPHLGLLQLAGADCRQFLQGQVTCDVRCLDAGQIIHGAHCNPKGRMLSNFNLLSRADDCLWMSLQRSVVPALLGSLSKYAVFSKSKLEDSSETGNCFGVMAEPAALTELCHRLALDIEVKVWEQNGVVLARIDEQRLLGWNTGSGDLPASLAALPWEDAHAWKVADIQAGRGWVESATIEEFLPQALNLQCQPISGISFTKGCYTGQEIVARMHYKGKLKRHMHRFCIQAESELDAGHTLYDATGARAVGKVVNSIINEGVTEFLASVDESVLESGALLCPGAEGQKIERKSLPYAITS